MKHRAKTFALAGALGLMMTVQALAEPPAEKPKVDPPGDVLQMSDHYSGSTGQIGEFPGILVCLRSKEAFVPLSAQDCGSADHVYALQMKDDKVMRPIQAGSKEAEQQMPQLLGQTVMVSGRFHTETGLLIASSIKAKEPTS